MGAEPVVEIPASSGQVVLPITTLKNLSELLPFLLLIRQTYPSTSSSSVEGRQGKMVERREATLNSHVLCTCTNTRLFCRCDLIHTTARQRKWQLSFTNRENKSLFLNLF